MTEPASTPSHDRERLFQDMAAILQDMTSDWDTGYEGGIRPDTRLIGDLSFESIDVVQLIVAIEERYRRKDLPFVDLVMHEGRYKEELTVAEIVEFLAKSLPPK